MSNISKDFKTLLESIIEQYDKMRRDYTLSQNGGAQFGYAVITPTTVSYISPNNLARDYYDNFFSKWYLSTIL